MDRSKFKTNFGPWKEEVGLLFVDCSCLRSIENSYYSLQTLFLKSGKSYFKMYFCPIQTRINMLFSHEISKCRKVWIKVNMNSRHSYTTMTIRDLEVRKFAIFAITL